MRAGVGNATIYRWWEGRAALAVDCFFTHTQDDLHFLDLGSARADFEQQVLQLGKLLRSPLGKALLSMMVGAKSDPVSTDGDDGWRDLWSDLRSLPAAEPRR